MFCIFGFFQLMIVLMYQCWEYASSNYCQFSGSFTTPSAWIQGTPCSSPLPSSPPNTPDSFPVPPPERATSLARHQGRSNPPPCAVVEASEFRRFGSTPWKMKNGWKSPTSHPWKVPGTWFDMNQNSRSFSLVGDMFLFGWLVVNAGGFSLD